MSGSTMMKFLKVNHSVRLMKENDRRFLLPRGPMFPQFGGAAAASKPMLTHEMAPAGGARLCRVRREPDILDDEYRFPVEHHGHGLGHWGEVLRRVFGGTSRE